MEVAAILLIVVIGLAAIFGILAAILEMRAHKPKYETFIKICYMLIGIAGAALAWLAFFGFPP